MVLSKKPVIKQAQVSARMGQIRAIDKRVKNLESSFKAQETKKKYTTYNEQVIGNNATLQINQQINTLVQGDGTSEIDGNSYALTGIAGRFLFHNVSQYPTLMRLAVIRIKSNASFTTAGEDLFLGSAGLGLNFSSATEPQRYFLPFNSHKYDIIYSENVLVGGKNATYTNDYHSNQIVSFYKRYKNRKETVDTSAGGDMNTSYRLIIFPVDCAMDSNTLNMEVTGQTVFYYKDN